MSQHKELHEYISKEKEKGVHHEDIKKTLIDHGWDHDSVEKGLRGGQHTPPPVPPTPSPATSPQKPKKSFVTALIIIIILAIVGVGGVFAYQQLWNSPKRVVGSMFENLQSLDSFTIDGTLRASIDLERISAEDAAALEQTTGGLLPLSAADRYAQDLELSFDGALESFTNVDEMTFRTALSLPDGLAMNMIFFPEQNYLQLAAYPGIDMFLPADTILNRWVLVDFAELQSQLGLDALVEEIDQQKELNPPKPLLTPEQEQSIRERILSEEVFSLTTLEDREMGEATMYRYAYSINMQALQTIIKDTQTMISDEVAAQMFEEVLAIMQLLDSNISGEMWVGKDDHQLHKLIMQAEVMDRQGADDAVAGTVTLTINISNHNQDQNITAPSEYTTIQELLEEILSASMFGAMPIEGESRPGIPVNVIDTDDDGLEDDLEALYNTDPNNPDTDADGYTDFEEILNGYDPTEAQ